MNTLALILSILGGTSAVLNALFAYFGKLRLEKYKSDLEATNKKLSILVDREIHIGKVQFNNEFKIYQEIWAKLVLLRMATISLRPEMDIVDSNESEPERKKRRLGLFNDALIGFRDAMENNRPFYAECVYLKLNEIIKICHLEGIQYSRQRDFQDLSSWDKAEKNRNSILDGIENCCIMIRSRIHTVEVSGGA